MPDPLVTDEQLEALRKKELANIIRKLNAGQTLTNSERKFLEEQREAETAPPDLSEMSNAELADYYNVSVSTIKRYRNERGVDVTDPEAMAAAIARPDRRGPQAGSGRNGDEEHIDDEEMRQWKAREIRAKALRAEFWLNVDKRLYVEAAEVREQVLAIAGATKASLLRLSRELPPVLLGLDEPGSQKVIEQYVDRILAELADLSSDLYKEPDDPEAPGRTRRTGERRERDG